MARGKDLVSIPALAAACARSDIVIADRRLPSACKPRLLKADRALLGQTGGLAIDLVSGRVRTVAETQGEHGWFRRSPVWQPRARRQGPAPTATGAPEPTATQ
jgi:competence protein ComEC